MSDGRPLRILLVTSWDTACGIADYATHLKTHVEAADPAIEIIPSPEALDPRYLFAHWGPGFDLVHLNHHDALHSRWTPDDVAKLSHAVPVVVTYHDTTEDPPPDAKIRQLQQVASSLIVHEPVRNLPAIVWRQGIPRPAAHPAVYWERGAGSGNWWDGAGFLQPASFKAYPQQPVLGTVGFHFPWKNYDRLCEESRTAGWALVILSANATPADVERWQRMNPHGLYVQGFVPGPQVVNYLAGCDATAFMYECANTGTSGAIRQGIAALKPVIALETCRQFRDLHEAEDETVYGAINWIGGWNEFHHELELIRPARYDDRVRVLARLDSWARRGADHARLYRVLTGTATAGELEDASGVAGGGVSRQGIPTEPVVTHQPRTGRREADRGTPST